MSTSPEPFIVAVLQARVSSTRFPGKVLQPLKGAPMLARQVERVKRAKSIDRLIVATSAEPSDEAIVDLCLTHSIECFRGSLDDVLDRFYRASAPLGATHVVRLTGDCPLIDPAIIDRVVEHCLTGDFDYASNTLRPTWPDGLDVEVVRFEVLARAWQEATLASDREHVTPYIHRRPSLFRLGNLEQNDNLSAHRWTVDQKADLIFVQTVYEALFDACPAFNTNDILDLLAARPELLLINGHFERNEDYARSLAAEQPHT